MALTKPDTDSPDPDEVKQRAIIEKAEGRKRNDGPSALSTQRPTVGRAVHYYQNPTQPYPLAGTVAYVHSETLINLGFLSGNGVPSNATSIAYSEESTHGPRWCWPPRV